MKSFSILTLLFIITLVISSCGAEVAPTMNAVDIQSSAAAVAFTIVAQTQSAIPTTTPLPPTPAITDTPAPTNTFLPLPSPTAPNGNSGSGDPCVNSVLPALLQGDTVKIRINNSTKATLAVSVYLNQTLPQSVCGYRTYSIDPQQSLVINNLVEGCYTLWAWNPDPKDYFIVTNGAATCVDDANPWIFDISTGSIKLK